MNNVFPEDWPDDPDVPRGRYRHYKGKAYLVLGVARHSETDESLVVYRPDYGDRALWVRPKAMFLEAVEIAGRRVARFDRINDSVEPSAQNDTSPG